MYKGVGKYNIGINPAVGGHEDEIKSFSSFAFQTTVYQTQIK